MGVNIFYKVCKLNSFIIFIFIFVFLFSCKKNDIEDDSKYITLWNKIRDNRSQFISKFWSDRINADLGYSLKYIAVSNSGNAFNTMVNTHISANNTPDIMPYLNRDLFYKLLKQDKLKNLKEDYEKFASPTLRKNVESYSGYHKLANLTGKTDGLYSISQPYALMYKMQIGWIRKDWLENLNLEIPKNLNDVYKIAQLFTNNDPDGNGKKDTYGLGIGSNLFDGVASANLIFAYFESYPYKWVKNSQGKIELSGMDSKTKKALSYLKKMYEEGLIYEDYQSLSSWDYKAIQNSGIFFGYSWSIFNNHKDSSLSDKFVPFILYTEDGYPVKQIIDLRRDDVIAMSVDSKHSAGTLIKIANYTLESYYGKNATIKDGDKIYENMPFLDMEDYKEDIENIKTIWEALKSNDSTNLNARQSYFYNEIVQSPKGPVDKYMGINSSMGLVVRLIDDKNYIINSYIGYEDSEFNANFKIKNKMNEIFQSIISQNVEIEDTFDLWLKFFKNNKGNEFIEMVIKNNSLINEEIK